METEDMNRCIQRLCPTVAPSAFRLNTVLFNFYPVQNTQLLRITLLKTWSFTSERKNHI